MTTSQFFPRKKIPLFKGGQGGFGESDDVSLLLQFPVFACELREESVAFQLRQKRLINEIRGPFTAQLRHSRGEILHLALQRLFHWVRLQRQGIHYVIFVQSFQTAWILFAHLLAKTRQRDI